MLSSAVQESARGSIFFVCLMNSVGLIAAGHGCYTWVFQSLSLGSRRREVPLPGADLRAADSGTAFGAATRTRRSTSSSSAGCRLALVARLSRGWRTPAALSRAAARTLPAYDPPPAELPLFTVSLSLRADGSLAWSWKRKTGKKLKTAFAASASVRYSGVSPAFGFHEEHKTHEEVDTLRTLGGPLRAAGGASSRGRMPTRACGSRASLCDGAQRRIGPGPRRR